MDMIDISKIKSTDLDSIADFMFSEIQSQINKVTFNELVTRMKRFNAKIETTLGVFTEKSEGGMEELKFYGHTTLGKNWNYIQSEIYSRLFTKLGIQILSKQSDTMGYSFTIRKKAELQ